MPGKRWALLLLASLLIVAAAPAAPAAPTVHAQEAREPLDPAVVQRAGTTALDTFERLDTLAQLYPNLLDDENRQATVSQQLETLFYVSLATGSPVFHSVLLQDVYVYAEGIVAHSEDKRRLGREGAVRLRQLLYLLTVVEEVPEDPPLPLEPTG